MKLGLRGLRLGNKLSALVALSVVLTVLVLGVNFEVVLRQSFLDNKLNQIQHAFQRLNFNLKRIESDLTEAAHLAGHEASVIASIELINQVQNKARYNTVLIDEEKKSLAKKALDRVKFSQSNGVAIYDQNNELVAFASLKDGVYQLGYMSFASGHAQTLIRPETGLEYLPATSNPGYLPDDQHIAPVGKEKIAEKQLASYQRIGNKLILRSHQDVIDLGTKRFIGHIEFSHVIDDDFFASLSKDMRIQLTQVFVSPLSAQATEIERYSDLTALNVIESDQQYLGVAHKNTLSGPVYFTVTLDRDHESALIDSQRRQLLLVLLVIGGCLLLFMRGVFGRSLEQPLKQLMQQIHQIKQGNYALLPAPDTSDELEEVGHSVNALASALSQRETELRESEQKTQALASSLHEAEQISRLGSWTLDLLSGQLHWSAEIYRLFELDPQCIVPSDEVFLAAIHPDDRAAVRQAYKDSLVSQTICRIEQRLYMADGRIKWVVGRCRSEFDAKGRPLRSIGTLQDITERKLAELALSASHSLLMTVLDSIPMRVFWKDKHLKYLGCNTAFAQDAGKQVPADVIGKDDFQMDWAAQADLYRADDQQVMDAGVPKLFYDEVQTTPQGQVIWLRTSKIPLKDQGGAVFGVLGVYEDISQRKQDEDQVRKLSQVAEQSPESVLITDLEGKIEYVNCAFVRNTGYELAEVLGQTPRILQTNLTPKSTFSAMWRTLMQGQRWSGELVNQRKDTTIFTDWAVISPLRNEAGLVTHYVSVQDDITEKKRLAAELDTHRHGLTLLVAQRTAELTAASLQAETANLAKSRFLANMSHEIRSPLNAILGLAYLLEQSRLDQGAHAMVHKIRDSGRMLLGVISDILDMSKIEAGQLQIEQSAFDLAAVIDAVAVAIGLAIGGKDIELIVSPLPPGVTRVVGDELRLQQVLTNLGSNAAKFTQSGRIELRLELLSSADGSESLRFCVQDTGIGLAPEVQDSVFSAFSQADTSTTRRFGGTGLGLAICRQLVILMGGEIGVSSVPGAGSEFWFTLPLQRTDDVQDSSPNMVMVRVEALIADDDAIAREAIGSLALNMGWQINGVDSGAAVLAHLLERKGAKLPSVLVLDWEMHGMDGLATVRAVRAGVPQEECPIVIMGSPSALVNLSGQPGADLVDAVLTKPVTSSGLYNAVMEAWRHRATLTGNVRVPLATTGDSLAGVRVLVVDDSDINCDVAKRILECAGAVVSLAADGQLAIDWLLAHPFDVDLVLMDVQMPVLDGMEATRRLRRMPQFDDLPIVALTAGAFESQKAAALDAGMTHFVSKPFDVPSTIALIRRLRRPPDFAAADAGAQAVSGGQAPASFVTPETAVAPVVMDEAQGRKLWSDESTYQSYLRRFIDAYSDVVQRVRAGLLNGDPSGAAALAHKLSGVAANLALVDTRLAAREVERVLGTQDDPMRALAALDLAVTAAIAEIHRYAPPVIDEGHAEPVTLTPAQQMDLKTQLLELLALLGSDNASAVKKHLSGLAPWLTARAQASVLACVLGYDFRGAEAATRQLASDYKIDLRN